MIQQMNSVGVHGSKSAGFAWLAYAEPGRNIAGFADAQVYQMTAPVQLRGTVSATATRLTLDTRAITPIKQADPQDLLERVGKQAAAKLDAHAARRLKRLATYADGWDHGQGRALTEESLVGLERLLELVNFTRLDVALFLSQDGRVLLNWPDAQGELVELEVAKDSLTCFMASTGDEFELPIESQAVSKVIARSR